MSLTIRAARAEDADALCAIRALPGVRRGTLALPFPRAEQSRRYVAELPKEDLALVAESEGEVVGMGSLRRLAGRRAHCASIGLMVHDGHVRRGVGTALMAALTDASDKWLSLLRLEL